MHNAQLFNEVEEKGEQLAIANEHKSQFLANMSHEVRTPLNAVLGYTELLLDGLYGDCPTAPSEVLERVQFNGTHLLALINDVLDLSKIEAGELVSRRRIIPSASPRRRSSPGRSLRSQGIGPRLRCYRRLPKGLGDERRLTQVLLNLIGNAIKFTEKGSVTHPASTASGLVRDRGRGYRPGHRAGGPGAHFRGPFSRSTIPARARRAAPASGFPFRKRFVEMHGGTIDGRIRARHWLDLFYAAADRASANRREAA